MIGVYFMKKFSAVFMAVVIIATAYIPSFALSEECQCGESPVIYVAALGSSPLTLDKGTQNERTVFRPDTDYVLKQFMPLVPAAFKLIATKNYDAFGDTLVGCVNSIFGELALDNEGNSSPRVTSKTFVPETDEHSTDSSYYFGYDFRLDPVENAKNLHTYVQQVKELTKHDTVRFRASSMGGVVTMAYISLYGSSDIETIIFQCCPLLGTAVAGELFNGMVEINKNALLRYAEQALPSLDSDFLAAMLYEVVEMLECFGVWDSLLQIADKLVLNLKDRFYDECLIPIFSTMPGIWSFVPDEYYITAKDYMRLDPATHAVLIDKIDFYHYEIQSKAEELLKGAQADGTNIYILAGYNMQRTPLVTAYKETSDATVDTKYASCGAVCAPLGEQLGDGYTQAAFNENNYISPDRMIDASTCILPESTWFVKDMLHSTIHDGHKKLYKIMLESDEQLTVFDYEEYPQFLQNDTVNKTLTPVTEPKSELEDSIHSVIYSTSLLNIVKLLNIVVKLFVR